MLVEERIERCAWAVERGKVDVHWSIHIDEGLIAAERGSRAPRWTEACWYGAG